jgi:hypothetical protein
MPYYPEKNILFIHIPKTGGTVIENKLKNKYKECLYSGETNNKLPHPYCNKSLQHQLYSTIYKYKNKLNINFKDLKLFAVVRNPFDRIISDLFHFNLIQSNYTSNQVYNVIINNYLDRNDLDNHNIPQYKFVTDEKGELIKNIKIFKTEKLNKINEELNTFLDVNINIKKQNTNKDYSQYFNKKSVSIILKFYKKDFDLFNYNTHINYINTDIDNLKIIDIGLCNKNIFNTLDLINIKYEKINLQKVVYNSQKNYIIVIKNPIERFITAFYYRYFLVCDSKHQNNRFKNEKNILSKYKNIDDLCNDLETNPNIFNGNMDSGNYIHWLKEDIYFHLEDFIKQCPKNKNVIVICNETYKKDMKNIFNIDIKIFESFTYDNTITDKSYKILKNYLKNNYMIIDKMYEYGWINDNQYKYLKL